MGYHQTDGPANWSYFYLYVILDIFSGRVDAVYAARRVALDRAFAEHPARFVNRVPVPFAQSTATWINRPARPLESRRQPCTRLAHENAQLF